MTSVSIAIDAMGGDFGLDVTIPATLRALEQHDGFEVIMVGDETAIELALHANHANHNPRIQIQHASQAVAMGEQPSLALRTKKDSSMRVAINLVKEGRARACVSGGNTGALMVTARFVLKTLPGVERPAIVCAFPPMNRSHDIRVLDLGANVDSNADNLYQFAVMGSVLVSALDNNPAPRVGLLNIGVEEIKGNDQVKLAAQLLAKSELNYIGYVEGDALFSGVADVVVCDGFVGNVALKTTEGVVKLIACYVRQEFMRSLKTKLAAIVAKPVLKCVKDRLDPGRYNGASFIGLNGIVVKSHGGADVFAFTNAIKEACLEVEKDIPNLIRQRVGILLEDQE